VAGRAAAVTRAALLKSEARVAPAAASDAAQSGVALLKSEAGFAPTVASACALGQRPVLTAAAL